MPEEVNIATSDSSQVFPNAVHHYKHYHRPAYPDGLTDSLPQTVSSLRPLTSYPLIEDRQGADAQTYSPTPAHSSVMMILLVTAFLLIAYCARRGSDFFKKMRNSLWSVKRRENTFDEHTSNEALLMILLIALSLIMGGIVIYSALTETLQGAMHMSMPLAVIASIGVAATIFLFHLAAGGATALIFSDVERTKLWLTGLASMQIFLGLALTPVALLMLFAPQFNPMMTQLAVCLYIAGKIIFLIKGVRIFYNNPFQWVYFILYLCTIEIAPLWFLFNRAYIV